MEVIITGGGRHIMNLTVGDLATILEGCSEDGSLPKEWKNYLKNPDNYVLRDNLRQLGLCSEVYGEERLRTTDLGLKVLKYFKDSLRFKYPIEFAKRVAGMMSESSKPLSPTPTCPSGKELEACVKRGIGDAKAAAYDAKQAPRLRKGR